MELSREVCERARQSRDARFDGRFFVAVRSTGIFCRPTCPVQPPRADRVSFHATAAAAMAAGYRPCLRCLPELAPGRRNGCSGPELVRRALRLIDDGYLDSSRVVDLAARLGVTPRHLGRLFEQEVGATPHRLAQARRLLFAKQLLDDSALTMTEIAYAAGFGSLRRFNSTVKATWRRPPGMLRRHPASGPGDGVRLRLAYRPPFDWQGLLDHFAGRVLSGIEAVDGKWYRRTLRCGDGHGWLRVGPAEDGSHALILHAHVPELSRLPSLVGRVRRMFDLDADPLSVQQVLQRDPLLAPVLELHPGLRVPGAWDPFETAVRAILGQQVSVAAARTLAGRIVEAFGESLDAPPDAALQHLFPTPERLAGAPLEELGVLPSRARSIRTLARETARGRIDFGAIDLVDTLMALPGIGDWTAQYIALRSGLDPDAFPAADLGLLRGAGDDDDAVTPSRLRRRAERWRPWRAYAAICLWRRDARMRPDEARRVGTAAAGA